MKVKNFYSSKDIIKRMKRQANIFSNEKKIFAMHVTTKVSYPEYVKNLHRSIRKRQTTS